MLNTNALPAKKNSFWLINAISIAVPIAVAILLGIPVKLDLGEWTRFLPHAVGAINSLTTVFLIAGLIFIKQNKINLHRASMTAAFLLGAGFLVCYVIYHLTNSSARYGGEGFWRYFYFFVLISHISLSLVVLPLVLRAMYFAVAGEFDRHKRIVKFAYPIWLYVSVTGVIVYAMVYAYR
jgi:putative membrane protein